jgi:hypothetical protein
MECEKLPFHLQYVLWLWYLQDVESMINMQYEKDRNYPFICSMVNDCDTCNMLKDD